MPGKSIGRPKSKKPKKRAVTIKMDDEMYSEMEEEITEDPELDPSKIIRKALREHLDRRKRERQKK